MLVVIRIANVSLRILYLNSPYFPPPIESRVYFHPISSFMWNVSRQAEDKRIVTVRVPFTKCEDCKAQFIFPKATLTRGKININGSSGFLSFSFFNSIQLLDSLLKVSLIIRGNCWRVAWTTLWCPQFSGCRSLMRCLFPAATEGGAGLLLWQGPPAADTRSPEALRGPSPGTRCSVDAEAAVHLRAPRTEMALCVLPGSRKISSPIEIHGSQKSAAMCPQQLMDIRWNRPCAVHQLLYLEALSLSGAQAFLVHSGFPSFFFFETRLFCKNPLSSCTGKPLTNLPSYPADPSKSGQCTLVLIWFTLQGRISCLLDLFVLVACIVTIFIEIMRKIAWKME